MTEKVFEVEKVQFNHSEFETKLYGGDVYQTWYNHLPDSIEIDGEVQLSEYFTTIEGRIEVTVEEDEYNPPTVKDVTILEQQ